LCPARTWIASVESALSRAHDVKALDSLLACALLVSGCAAPSGKESSDPPEARTAPDGPGSNGGTRLADDVKSCDAVVLGRATAEIHPSGERGVRKDWRIVVEVDEVLRGSLDVPRTLTFLVHSPSRDFGFRGEDGGRCALALYGSGGAYPTCKVLSSIPAKPPELESVREAVRSSR
jgi:hypothetical protein